MRYTIVSLRQDWKWWFHGVMDSTLDSESRNLSSNLGATCILDRGSFPLLLWVNWLNAEDYNISHVWDYKGWKIKFKLKMFSQPQSWKLWESLNSGKKMFYFWVFFPKNKNKQTKEMISLTVDGIIINNLWPFKILCQTHRYSELFFLDVLATPLYLSRMTPWKQREHNRRCQRFK